MLLGKGTETTNHPLLPSTRSATVHALPSLVAVLIIWNRAVANNKENLIND
jgi:hypothetical protein